MPVITPFSVQRRDKPDLGDRYPTDQAKSTNENDPRLVSSTCPIRGFYATIMYISRRVKDIRITENGVSRAPR